MIKSPHHSASSKKGRKVDDGVVPVLHLDDLDVVLRTSASPEPRRAQRSVDLSPQKVLNIGNFSEQPTRQYFEHLPVSMIEVLAVESWGASERISEYLMQEDEPLYGHWHEHEQEQEHERKKTAFVGLGQDDPGSPVASCRKEANLHLT